MSDDVDAAAAPSHGEPWLATANEDKYTLSIDDAIERYKAAGIPRIRRTIQRYCSNKTLDAHRFAIPYGEKYLITSESLERHIAYILQGKAAMADPGEPRRDTAIDLPATPDALAVSKNEDHHLGVPELAGPSTLPNESDARVSTASADIIEMLRDENGFLKEQIIVKDAQLAVKDRQIADQSERVRETNLLVASLHKLITPLIGHGRSPEAFPAPADSVPDGLDIHSAPQ